MQIYTRIGRPFEAHGVRTELEYRAWQLLFIGKARAKHTGKAFTDPAPAAADALDGFGHPIAPFVSGGRWVVLCACGNGPSYDPAWQLALCPECGLQYVALAPPEDWQAIEVALMRRPEMSTRNWGHPLQPRQTLAELEAENLLQGVA